MGLIRFNIKTGTAPFTAKLIGSNLDLLTDLALGEHQFIVDEGDYTLRITDSDNCISDYSIDFCECPPDYESVNGGCVKYEQEAASLNLPLKQIYKKNYNIYGGFGTLIFDEGWLYNGTGTYEKIDIGNPYWINASPGTLFDGPLNRTAVWAETILSYQDIGFSVCIDLEVEKTYYVGFGCDNWSKIKVNGIDILDQGHRGGTLSNAILDLKNMLNTDDQVAFKYWFIYPVIIKAGRNIIEVKGHNHTLLAAFGMQIYDASKIDLMNATSDADLEGKILFSTESMINEYLDFTDSVEDGYRGYHCEDGFALVTCEGDAFCEKKIFIDCI